MSRAEIEAKYQEALTLARTGQPVRAIALLADAHAQDGRHVGVRNALGVLRLEQGDASGAVAMLKPLAKELPEAAPILVNLGNALIAARRADDAIAPLKKAATLEPREAATWYAYGRALQVAGRAADAVEAYDRALALDPLHLEAQANRSAALMFVGRYDDADQAARSVVARAPEHANAHFNRAMALLARGDWVDGWREYEWRERTSLLDNMRRKWTQPRWEGEPLEGRTILVHAEQGLGDTLQFVRWLAPLRARGARVVLAVPTALQSLLAGSEVADVVVSFSDPMPAHDVQVALTSLPHRLGLHTAAAVMGSAAPYLKVPAVMDASLAAWCAELPGDRPRIGLVWAGSGTHVNDMHRSIPVGVFEPLLKRTDVTWVSLQQGERAVDLTKLPRRLSLQDPSALLTTFQRTGQLLRQLDAVITIDSAVAHLAGALGRRTWLLLPQVGLDWRWAAETPAHRWYASVEPIRQAAAGEWRQAVLEVQARLGGLVAANGAVSAGARNR
jgi:tetratricopeptide (TPR) repeat protein